MLSIVVTVLLFFLLFIILRKFFLFVKHWKRIQFLEKEMYKEYIGKQANINLPTNKKGETIILFERNRCVVLFKARWVDKKTQAFINTKVRIVGVEYPLFGEKLFLIEKVN